jgi:hypothetical protein
MPVEITDLVVPLQTLFTVAAEQAARQAQLIRRHRKLTPAAFAQGLVFAWLQNPRASTDELVTSLARAGVSLQTQSLDARFTPQAAEFFRLLLNHASTQLLNTTPRALGLLARFPGVYLLDATSVALPAALADLWPGCGGRGSAAAGTAALKIVVRYEVGRGVLESLAFQPGRQGDATSPLQTAPLPPGSLRLADLGYFDFAVLAAYHQQQVRYVSRVQSHTIVYDSKGRKWKLAAYLAKQRADRVDRELWLGNGKKLQARLLAVRAPQAVCQRRQERARQVASEHGNQVSADTLALCGWTVFVTNLPRGLLSLVEVWVLYRVRWQIELLFKLWKSDGGIAASSSGKPQRVLCEVYAKLLGMVLQHWLLLASGGAGLGSQSQRKAARAVRSQISHVAAVVAEAALLAVALTVVARMVRAAGRVNRRTRRPATFQTLLHPEQNGLCDAPEVAEESCPTDERSPDSP